MVNSQLIVAVLIRGAIAAVVVSVVAFLLSRFTRDIIGRSLLVILLFVAAGAYFGFAWDAGPIWLLIELVQSIILGTMALFGWRDSPYWLAVGWALHPFWEIGLHLIGPGQAFTPMTYPIACISFDLLVAAYIVIVYGRGLLGDHRLALRN